MTIQQPLLELTTSLKQLKLSGMVKSLELRNEQAITNQMAYCDFLSLLAQDELLARENNRYDKRLKAANLNNAKNIESFNCEFNPKINGAFIKNLATCHFVLEKEPVIIVGPCGTGKSHLAQAIGFCAIKKGFDVICASQGQLSQELQAAKATNTYQKKIKIFSQTYLLIIDDFALKPLSVCEEEDLYEIVARRYEKTATLITSNLNVHEWSDAFSNKLLGAALIDRMKHDAHVLILEGTSYRSPKGVTESNKAEQ